MRARRLVAVLAVATLGVVSLVACGRAAPGTAAFVGDASYSVDRVNAIYDEARAGYADAVRDAYSRVDGTPPPEELQPRFTRQDVVNLLVSLDLGRRIADDERISVPDQTTAEQFAPALQVPPQAEYARLWAEWVDLYTALVEGLPRPELSDEAITRVYEALIEVEAIPAGLSMAEVRQAFGTGEFVQATVAVSDALHDAAETAGTSVNPQYQPLGMPAAVNTQQGTVFYSMPYVDAESPVIDLTTAPDPTPAP